MDRENGFAVSEREVIDIKIHHKSGVFFCRIYNCFNFQNDYRHNKSHKITSDFLAGSINTNPVIVRKILMQLKKYRVN